MNGAGMGGPAGILVDALGHLWVGDIDNNRGLGWRSAATFSDGAPADVVVGQPDFVTTRCNGGGVGKTTLCEPVVVAVDSASNLYVADTDNNRALEFPTPFAACQSFPCVGPPASVVLGQPDFTGRFCNQSQSAPDAKTLCFPEGIAVDAKGNLFLSDTSNARIVEFAAPLSNGESASLVLGQNDFVSDKCNRGNGVPDATTLCVPEGMTTDAAGSVYVTDAQNNRVVKYTGPLSNGEPASLVIGQIDFASGECNRSGPPSAATLCFPVEVALDASGNLYIADTGNNRSLGYNAPQASGATASMVFGQAGSFSNEQCSDGSGTDPAPSADNLCDPADLSVDKSSYDLYVADRDNQRLLVFDNPSGPAPGLPPAGTIKAPLPITIKTSGGQMVTAGTFQYTNASTGSQLISSVTVTVTNQGAFSSLTLAAGSSTATVSPAQAVDQFVFEPPLQVAASARLSFTLTAQSASSGSTAASVVFSTAGSDGRTSRGLPMGLGLMLSAAIAALLPARRPRRMCAALLVLVVFAAACGGSNGGRRQTVQTASVSHNGLLSRSISLSSVSLDGTSTAFELATLTFTAANNESNAAPSIARPAESGRNKRPRLLLESRVMRRERR